MPELPSALLVLEDGTRWPGRSFGAPTTATAGEVVFNTSLTGYQEILSDPSYHGQLVTMTMPQIGNNRARGGGLAGRRSAEKAGGASCKTYLARCPSAEATHLEVLHLLVELGEATGKFTASGDEFLN